MGDQDQSLSRLGPRRAGAGGDGRSAAAATTPEGLGFLLGIVQRARRRAWEAVLADLRLTAPQAAVLRLVVAQPGRGVRQLARALGTDPTNATRIAETLCVAGLCEGAQDPHDARRRPLYPTARGRAIADEVESRAEREEERLFAALGARQYRALIDGLTVLLTDTRSKVAE